MAMPQVLQGTWKELAVHAAELGDKRLTLIIPSDSKEVGDAQPGIARPRQPEEVKTKERLEELVLEGLASPAREMTEMDWQELKRRAQNRVEGKIR